eukprot:GHVH01001192.1.p1 GENE.GHVH01001192.1~~GHVH01001192.1.p1  ORF type:complete len:817 (+),score=115.80 GHVH01001192.1:136-2586(+)
MPQSKGARPNTKPSRSMKKADMDLYRTDGERDTDLKGFSQTAKNDPSPNQVSNVKPNAMQTTFPVFNEEYFEAFDVCFSFPRHFKPKKENKVIPAAKAEKMIMKILCARNSSEDYDDVRSLHKCYGLSAKEVQKDFTHGEMRELFLNATVNVINRIGCFTAKSHSQDGANLLIRCKLEEEACKRHADMKNYPLQMDYNVTSFEQFKQDPSFSGPFVPYERCIERTTRDGSAMDKIGHVWQRYDRISRPFNHEFSRGDEELSIFRDMDRVRLLMEVLNEYINVKILEDKKFITAAYPLHQPAPLEALKNSWGNFKLCWTPTQPFDQIREYFGEKIALYYAWLNLYCYMLVIPAAIGTILYVLEITFDYEMNYTAGWLNYIRVLYCAVVTAWATWFYQLWQRRESVYRLRWGSEVVTGNLPSPQKNPYFKPECNVVDPINPNGKVVRSVKPSSHIIRKLIAGFLACTITFIAVCVVNDEAVNSFARMFGLMGSTDKGMTWESAVGADQPDSYDSEQAGMQGAWFVAYLPLVILVKIVGLLWDRMIIQSIAKFENNPFFEDYYKSVTIYSFIFKFANHLIPLLYLAFMKEYFGELCKDMDDGRCIKSSRKMLQSFFTAGLFGNLMEIGLPFAKNWMASRKAKKLNNKVPFYETQAYTKTYDSRAQIKDFQEVMLEFCFVALFGVIFPLMPLLNLIVTMVEIRSDAYKLTHVYRRTWPDAAPEGVGAWNTIQRSITFGCVITNVLLCGLVTIGYHRSLIFKLTFSLMLLLLTLGFKEFLEYRYPSTSKKYRTQKARSHVVHFEAIWGTKNMETKSTPIGY